MNSDSSKTLRYDQIDPASPIRLPETKRRSSTLKTGQILLDDYIIEKKLGHGGMGSVFLVRRLPDGRYYAIKTPLEKRIGNAQALQDFYRELRTWIDLPDHPNLVSCFFFRTCNARLYIFSEYLNGGSLKSWISRHKIDSLPRILDIAIQTAWGLQAAHDQGVVHQDIKPGNIMMTSSGMAKVSDFGLAGVRAGSPAESSESSVGAAVDKSDPVTSHGMTVAYCSPEQASGERVGISSDIWSWGLIILEMFSGRLFWRVGPLARTALEMHLAEKEKWSVIAMPSGIVDILKRCFEENPHERWTSLNEVADRLIEIYRIESGMEYPRYKPATSYHPTLKTRRHERRTTTFTQWDDPEIWVQKAIEAGASGLSRRISSDPSGFRTRRDFALADLGVFEEAQRMFESLIAAGSRNLETILAHMMMQKGKLQREVNDYSGSDESFERAVRNFEICFERSKETSLVQGLAVALSQNAYNLMNQRKYKEAGEIYQRVIELLKGMPETPGDPHLRHILADVSMHCAITFWYRGNDEDALRHYSEASSQYEALDADGYSKSRLSLIQTRMNISVFHANREEYAKSIELCDKAIGLLELMIRTESRNDLRSDLAKFFANKAKIMMRIGRLEDASILFSRAGVIFEDLIDREGMANLREMLALLRNSHAELFYMQHSIEKAIEMRNSAIGILENLFHHEGQNQVGRMLADYLHRNADALIEKSELSAAWNLCGRSILILEDLCSRQGRIECEGDLHVAHLIRATILELQGKRGEALLEFERVLPLLDVQIQQRRRADLIPKADRFKKTYQTLRGSPE